MSDWKEPTTCPTCGMPIHYVEHNARDGRIIVEYQPVTSPERLAALEVVAEAGRGVAAALDNGASPPYMRLVRQRLRTALDALDQEAGQGT